MTPGSKRSGLIAILLAGIIAAALSDQAVGASRKAKETAPEGPAVKLTVTPRHGFRPLTITLTGQLVGVEATDAQYCHAGVEWESTTLGGRTSSSKEDPRCLHPPEQVNVQFTFTKVLTLSQPDTYTFRLILHRRDGSRLLSNTQEVRVLDNM
jgi:hypothetical protein